MNVLLFKPGAIGDLLQLSPVVRALREKIPGARISVVVGGRPSVDLFRHHPDVDEVFVYDKRGEHRSWKAFAALRRELGARRFDLVVNYQRSNLKGWLLLSSCFPCRVLVYHKEKGRVMHAVENHLKAVAPVVGDPASLDRRLEFHLGDEERNWAGELAAAVPLAGKRLVGLNLGASHPVNRWPTRLFAELADMLSRAGFAVVLVGGGVDRPLADAVTADCTVPPLDMVGRTSLLQLGALLERCAAVVSADTGPMHMATAVGTPVVALFGAADPERTGPVGPGHLVLQAEGIPCVPCRSRSCAAADKLACMEAIAPERVMASVLSLIVN